MRKWLVLSFALLTGATGCDTNVDPVNCDFDQTGMLTNYADEIIMPRFSALVTGATLLDGAVQAFVASPSIGMLVEIRVSFAPTYLAYQRCSPFAFGPALIDGTPFRERFNTFPTNTVTIESAIQNGTSVEATTKSAVGFPALEYLIFGDGNMTDQQIVDLFTTDQYAESRKAYLSQLSAELKSTSTDILTGWDAYRSAFIANTGTADGTSISLLINELNFDFEVLKNFKFKIPLGKFNGGVVIPESVEAYYAGGSVQLAKEHLEGIQDLYLGIGENQADGLGLYEFVDCFGAIVDDEPLAEKIADQFNVISDALGQISDPMSETLVNERTVVDAAYQQMQMMVPLLKYEMTSTIGVQINYQDNDGD